MKLLFVDSFFFYISLCQCDIHLLEAVLHKQTTPKATTGWLNNHRLFSLFSTTAHCKFPYFYFILFFSFFYLFWTAKSSAVFI